MTFRRWTQAAILVAAVFSAGIAACEEEGAGQSRGAGSGLDCEAVLTGGRYPEIPPVELAPLAECRPGLQVTLDTLASGGPFPYPQDDEQFFNREGYLAPAESAAYREYTVDTPGLGHRGTRRLVTHGDPARDASAHDTLYYTDDHYSTFWRIIDP